MKFVLLSLLVLITIPAHARSVSIDAKDGLQMRWGEVTFKSGIRLHADGIYSDDPDVATSDTETDFRRARITNRVDWSDWRLRADYDFGVSEGFKNLFIEYRGLERKRIRVGNQVAPFGMEDSESSSDLAFMERSIASVLRPGLLQGVSYRQWDDQWSASVGVFEDELNNLDRRTAPGTSMLGRVTFAPLQDTAVHLHLGAGFEHRTIDDDEVTRYRARPFTRLAERRVLDTRSMANVDELRNFNQEVGLSYRTFRIQGEATQSKMKRTGQDLTFDSYYVTVTTAIGGEPYRYSRSRGVYRGLVPKAEWGALELALRYGELDLEDGSVTGGEGREFTVGAGWLISDQVRVQLNHSRIVTQPNRNGLDENYNVTGIRVQVRI